MRLSGLPSSVLAASDNARLPDVLNAIAFGRVVREGPFMTRADLRDMFERVTTSRGFTKAAGFRIRDFREGFVAMEAAPREDLLQYSGYVHAGVVTALADHAAGAAYASVLPEGRACLTIELKINFMKPALGDLLVAEATVISPGKSVGVVRSDVFAEKAGGRTHIAAALVSLKSVEFAPAG